MIKKIIFNLPQVLCNNILKLKPNSTYYISNLTQKQTNSNIEEVSQSKGQVQLKNKSSKLKTISNEGKRIQLEIMTKIQAPNFILEYIETEKYARNVKSFNIHLTNGGDEYEEFPLIKLLSIALKKVQEGNGEVASWKKLEYYIRKRLHRCTIQQNLKLLYIMLRIFPKYTFDYGFILSICLALKKQIDIMSIDELKSLYYVLYTNSNEQKRYNNEILSNIQSIILSKMLQRYRDKLRLQQAKKHIHLPLNNIYSWIALGLSLNLRTDYEQIVYENKIIELIEHFNLRWEAAFAKQQYNRSISDKEMSSLFVLFCMNDNLVKYSEVGMRKSNRNEAANVDFKQIFNVFKLNFLVANSRSVHRMLKNCSYLQGLKAFRSLLQIYQFEIIQNLLQEPEEININNAKQGNLFPKIRSTLQLFMKNSQNSQRIIYEKLKILSLLFNRSVISLFELQAFYSTIDLSNQVNYSLDICNELLLIELFIYSVSEKIKYQPRHSILRYIFGFLEIHNFTYRNFDWNSFNFVNLILQNQNQIKGEHSIGSNLPSQANKQSQISFRASKIMKKISQQVKIYNTQKLVQQQRQILQKKKQIKQIQKFFIQIRVNQMQKLQTIIAPFNRLPHFSNIKEKIAINALSQKEINLQSYKLQKKILNLIGWRVININTAEFLQFSINQRLNFIAAHLESENKEIKRIGGKQEMILYKM